MRSVLSEAEYAAYADWCSHYWEAVRHVAATGQLPTGELGDWLAQQRLCRGVLLPDQSVAMHALYNIDCSALCALSDSGSVGSVGSDGSDGGSVTEFVAAQRADFQALRMSPARASLLRVVPGWEWSDSPKQARWWAYRDLLIEYVEVHGHFPRRLELYRGCALGEWVRRQRLRCHRGADAARVAALEAVTGWSCRGKESGWRTWYALLLEYVKEFGAIPPVSTIYRGKQLGQWTQTQRVAMRGRRKMTRERARALENIDCWFWEPPPRKRS